MSALRGQQNETREPANARTGARHLTARAPGTRRPAQQVSPARVRKFGRIAGRHALLAGAAVLFLMPIYMMVLASLRPAGGAFETLVPRDLQWANYKEVLEFPGFPVPRLLGNSFLYTGLATLGTVSSSAVIAYGFARFRFPGREVLFVVILATMMLPFISVLIPSFILFRSIGWTDTYLPLIVPRWFGDPFYIFLLRQFFRTLPRSVFDAAVVDGAGEIRIFARIALPIMRPALIVVAVLASMTYWNDFLGPLVYLQDPDKYPLSVGLYAFQGQHDQTEWTLLMAAATLITVPMIALFFGLQRYFVSGMAFTGSKG